MGLEGKLADMPLTDLLLILQRSARSGKLMLQNAAECAFVWLRDGQAVHALVLAMPERRPLYTGEAAAYHLLAWEDGQFRYLPETARADYQFTIRQPTSTLIATALRQRRAEALRAYAEELTPQTVLATVPQLEGMSQQINLEVGEWSLLAQIGPQKTVQQLVEETATSFDQVANIVALLLDYGLVRRLALADLPPRRLVIAPPKRSGDQVRSDTSMTNLTRAIRRRLQQIAPVERHYACGS